MACSWVATSRLLKMPGGGQQKKSVYGDEPSLSPAYVTSKRDFPVTAPPSSGKQTLGTWRGRTAVAARSAGSAGWREMLRGDGRARRAWPTFWKVPDTATGTQEGTLRSGVSGGLASALGFRGAAWLHAPLSGWLRTRDGRRWA